ncbi:hypothetical protein [Enterobacter cloacae]|uniref:hypothetical protein n=1 Tax=Enterobacter cloacae TaxID=550 RepID=UPI002A7EB72E|nr:hypothetical protein [Enterobacter cloacae]
MSTITKEWLQQKIAEMEAARDEIPFGLDEDESNTLAALRIALASLETEPAIHRWRRVTVEPYGPYPWHYGNFIGFSKPVEGIEDEYFYSAPPASVVPEEATPENIAILASTFAPCGITYQWDRDECNAAADSWNACRAAMLQGADNEIQRKAAIHDALCEKYNVESLTDFVDWQRNHIAELEAAPPAPVGQGETAVMPDYPGYTMTQRECYQAGKKAGLVEAGSYPVIQDGLVMVPVELTPRMITKLQQNTEIGSYIAANWAGAYGLFQKFWDEAIAAAPQQEVKS